MSDSGNATVVFAMVMVLLVPIAVSLVGTLAVLGFARMHEYYAVPNDRSSHSVPTPTSGGLGIVVAVLFTLFAVHSIGEPVEPLPRDAGRWGYLFCAVLVASAIGFADDIWGLKPRLKLGLFLLAAWIAFVPNSIGVVHGLPWIGGLDLAWASVPLALFWLACFPQAFNFMDGIDGIAALSAIVWASVYCAAWSVSHAGELGGAAGAIVLATVGFLPLNFPKARIFMGDAGSLPLGLALAWCAIEANDSGALPFPASILLLGPFLFDVTFTLFRRWREGKTIGEAHKEHLYQRLSRVWGSHAKVSLLYAGFSVVTGALALSYASLSELGKLLSLVLPLAAMLGFAAYVLRAERQKGR